MILLVVSLLKNKAKPSVVARLSQSSILESLESIYGLFLDSVGHTNSVDEESNTLIESRSTRNEWCG